jgi:hypothetical protein
MAAAEGKALDPAGATEQVPERTESPKKRKPKGGVNLRKSLAWDSAFFTGEGCALSPLSLVNSLCSLIAAFCYRHRLMRNGLDS